MYYLVAFNSITFANRIKNYFKDGGGFIGVVHTPAEIAKGSCSYSVKIKSDNLTQVLDAAQRMGIQVKGIYRQGQDGSYQEVQV